MISEVIVFMKSRQSCRLVQRVLRADGADPEKSGTV